MNGAEVQAVNSLANLPWEVLAGAMMIGISLLGLSGGAIAFFIKHGKTQGEHDARLHESENEIKALKLKCGDCVNERKSVEGQLFDISREHGAMLSSIKATTEHMANQLNYIQGRVDKLANGH